MTLNNKRSTKYFCLVLFFAFFLFKCKESSTNSSDLSTAEKNNQHPVELKHETIDYKKAVDIIQNKKVVIIDIRSREHYMTGHIKHAVQIFISDSNFVRQIKNLNPTNHYLIYGSDDKNILKAKELFINQGFISIKTYDSGWDDWIKHGGIIEK